MRSLFAILVLCVIPAICSAAVIHVPGDQPTVQAGIDAASAGDTVLVAPGTYVENIDFLGKAITVKSSDGAESTVIDGGSPSDPDHASVVVFAQGEGLDSVLDGFTLTNGKGTLIGCAPGGGGILCDNSSPTIRNNIITKNRPFPVGFGGGIFCHDCSPDILYNTISENDAGHGGGGIFCSDSSPRIMYNVVEGNLAYHWGGGIQFDGSKSGIAPIIGHNIIRENSALEWGGGICYKGWAYANPPTIAFNDITENVGGFGGGIHAYLCNINIISNSITRNLSNDGGGIFCNYSDAFFMNNRVIANTANYLGGGIYSCGDPSPYVINNTLFGNTALNGGGVYTVSPYLTIANCILWDNTCSGAGPELCVAKFYYSNILYISYSNVEGGTSSVHVDPESTMSWGVGMIDANPLFVDSNTDDFHLKYSSPCRNTGDNSVVFNPLDFEGDPRIAWDGIVDMGADEFYNHLYCTGDFTPGSTVKGHLIGRPGTHPLGLFISTDRLYLPLHHAWGDFYLEAPWVAVKLYAYISPHGVLHFFSTIPAEPVAPYDLYVQALIGLESDSLTNLLKVEVR